MFSSLSREQTDYNSLTPPPPYSIHPKRVREEVWKCKYEKDQGKNILEIYILYNSCLEGIWGWYNRPGNTQ